VVYKTTLAQAPATYYLLLTTSHSIITNMKLHNTLTKKKEEFKPLDEKNVRMYVCGPTVYDRAHIGNARAVVVFDALYRTLRHLYGNNHVTYARNITDVDDKINAAAKERGIEISELTTNTTKMFHDDMAALNCLAPNIEPRATEHIEEMVQMCETLIANGNAYAAEGHVLFSVQSDEKYGHLSRRSRDEMIAGARVEIAPYKKDPADFVLWKPSSDDEPGWDSPWGRGRPGWHIECSVMSTKYLGETFDIHGGGADLKFPHHENEIAQSCCAYPGSEFTRYWVHNGFLSVEGEKMSKSLGNFVTVHDLLDDGVDGEIIRYALLATHYRKPLDWNKKALDDAKKALKKFYKVIGDSDETGEPDAEFIEALRDDLNTPKAYSILHKLADKGDASTLKSCANILGLPSNFKQIKASNSNLDDSIIKLIEERKAARDAKDWAESDRIRDELATQGIVLKDNSDGTTSWERG
jgi:cysteinyl-tRNA synthetase